MSRDRYAATICTDKQWCSLYFSVRLQIIEWICWHWLFYYYPHDDVIKWKHFLGHWLFVRGIHRSPVTSPNKGQWPGSLVFSLIGAWINAWVNNREAGDLRRHRAHYDVIVMKKYVCEWLKPSTVLWVKRNVPSVFQSQTFPDIICSRNSRDSFNAQEGIPGLKLLFADYMRQDRCRSTTVYFTYNVF